eukprot:630013-Pleurochrysis_carterae.AAC.2
MSVSAVESPEVSITPDSVSFAATARGKPLAFALRLELARCVTTGIRQHLSATEQGGAYDGMILWQSTWHILQSTCFVGFRDE